MTPVAACRAHTDKNDCASHAGCRWEEVAPWECLNQNTCALSGDCAPPTCSALADRSGCALNQLAINTLRDLQYRCRNVINQSQCSAATLERQCRTFTSEPSCSAQAPNCVWTTHTRPQCHTFRSQAPCSAKDGCWWVTKEICQNLNLGCDACQPSQIVDQTAGKTPAPAATCAQYGFPTSCNQTPGCQWGPVTNTCQYQQEEISTPGGTAQPAMCHWDVTNNNDPEWLKPEDAFYGNMLPFPDPCQGALNPSGTATPAQACAQMNERVQKASKLTGAGCTWQPPAATAPPDTCPKQTSAAACNTISGCQWSEDGFHKGADGKGALGVCQGLQGSCMYSATGSESFLSAVMSSEGCFRTGGLWLPPTPPSPALVTPPPHGFGWTCVDQKYDALGNATGKPRLLPNMDLKDCLATVCGGGGGGGTEPPVPAADLAQLTGGQLQELQRCWKPVFFNPCTGCKALPEEAAALLLEPPPPPGPAGKLARTLGRLFHGGAGILVLIVLLGLAAIAVFMSRRWSRASGWGSDLYRGKRSVLNVDMDKMAKRAQKLHLSRAHVGHKVVREIKNVIRTSRHPSS